VRDPGEERDALAAQDVRDVDRLAQELDPPVALGLRARDERGLVLAAGIEQEARARLDHAAQAEVGELRAEHERPLGQHGRQGIEVRSGRA
jgi:hypothetical protein